MLQFKRDGKIVESGIVLAPDFVCEAVKEYQSMSGFLGDELVWQGTGIGVMGDFETWEVSTVPSPK